MKNYDIVIVSHEKDFNNIKFIVEYAHKNLRFDSIHLILSDREVYNDMDLLKTLTDKPIFQHNENDVLKIDKSCIKHTRPNWIYQMLLKMFQNVTNNDNFLIIESDCIILKDINFFEDEKTIFYLCRDSGEHTPYFNFSNKILGLGREYNHSFISEFMMYDKKIINDLLYKCGCKTVYDFLKLIYNNVDSDCYPADYELYGNFCYKYYKDNFIIKHISYNFFGRGGIPLPSGSFSLSGYKDHEIVNIIEQSSDKDVVSFHTWI